jgi:lipopolysaccharide/colanic/teichoic acid biosynthesis glycosyltransferase
MVLSGRRSLVGPMSPVEGESLKPGVTGIWKASTGLPAGVADDRVDMYYVQNWSLSMDLEVIVSSVMKVARLFGSARPQQD